MSTPIDSWAIPKSLLLSHFGKNSSLRWGTASQRTGKKPHPRTPGSPQSKKPAPLQNKCPRQSTPGPSQSHSSCPILGKFIPSEGAQLRCVREYSLALNRQGFTARGIICCVLRRDPGRALRSWFAPRLQPLGEGRQPVSELSVRPPSPASPENKRGSPKAASKTSTTSKIHSSRGRA